MFCTWILYFFFFFFLMTVSTFRRIIKYYNSRSVCLVWVWCCLTACCGCDDCRFHVLGRQVNLQLLALTQSASIRESQLPFQYLILHKMRLLNFHFYLFWVWYDAVVYPSSKGIELFIEVECFQQVYLSRNGIANISTVTN